MGPVTELIAAVLVLVGALFAFSAALGIVRFPDVMTRLHAATKPQVFGLLLILTGVGLDLWSWKATSLMLLVIGFQVVTAPVAAHMVSRTAYRLGLWNVDEALVDELADDLEDAGFTHPAEEEEPGGRPSSVSRTWRPAAVPARPRHDGR